MAIPEYNSGKTSEGSVVKYNPPIGHNGSIQNGSDCICGIRIGNTASITDVMIVPTKNIQCDANCLDIDVLPLIEPMEPKTRLAVPI